MKKDSDRFKNCFSDTNTQEYVNCSYYKYTRHQRL